MSDNPRTLEQRTHWAHLIPKKNMIQRLGCNVTRPQESWPVIFDIFDESFSIGRGADANWVLTSQFISELMLERASKIHCRITKDLSNPENPVFIEDLSRNGTFVNGEKVGHNQKRILKTTDVISFNDPTYTVFQFVNRYREVWCGFSNDITDKYYIGRQLGSGGQGAVRLVIERKTCKTFAMKIVKKNLYGAFNEERLMREGKIMDQLVHPNIIRCHDTIVKEKNVYMFLDYMEGGDLLTRIISKDKLSVETAKHFFRQMCVAVKYLHDKNIIHRDIKPDNILLKSNDELTELKLADFGLSKLFSQDNLELHTLCGTPFFAAPEISHNIGKGSGAYTNKIDIWSLGVVLHAMFCPSFDLTEVKAGNLSFENEAFHNVPETAQDLIRKMLAVNPSKRLSIHEILNHPWLKEDNEAIEELSALFEDKIKEPPTKRRRVETSETDRETNESSLKEKCVIM